MSVNNTMGLWIIAKSAIELINNIKNKLNNNNNNWFFKQSQTHT